MHDSARFSTFKARLWRGVARILTLGAIAFSLAFIPTGRALAAPQLTETAGVNLALAAEDIVPEAAAPLSAASLFTSNCAGCHANGGNVIRRGKNLKQKALKRHGYDDVTKIGQIITNGRGIMAAYGDRLTNDEIGAIAQYVKTQSELGWQ